MKIVVYIIVWLLVLWWVWFYLKPKALPEDMIAKIGEQIGQMQDTWTNVATGTELTGTTVATVSPEIYTIVPNSTIGRIGRKLWGEHTGAIAIKNGSALILSWKLISWEIVIDMNSITNTDLTGDSNTKLIWHLKDGFFAVATNPEAKFTMLSVQSTTSGDLVSGDLTLKWVTKNISFYATVQLTSAYVKILATTYIDREAFGITEWAWVVEKEFGLVFDLTFNK
jgi:polyisoprenoid-binding protein YceI